MQRKYIALNDYFSPIPSLYEEDEVCSVVNCTFYKGFQLIARPILQSNDYITYSTRFKNYIYDFLYRNKTSYEVLKNIDDITRYYYLSLNNEDTVMGLILFISAIIIIIFMLGSLLFIFINKFKIYFSFLSNDFWIIYIIGLVLIVSNTFLELYERTSSKCHIKLFILCIGISFNLVPILHKLIVCFPEKDNKISAWVNIHKYLILLLFICIDIVLNLLTLIKPYMVINKIYIERNNFQICELNKIFSQIILYILFLDKILVILAIGFLIFIEWNIKALHTDIRFLVSSFYLNSIIIIIFIITKKTLSDDYVLLYSFKGFLYIFYSISNYILVYGYRIILTIFKNDSQKKGFKETVNKYFSMVDNSEMKNTPSKSIISSSLRNERGSIMKTTVYKIINYHYQTHQQDHLHLMNMYIFAFNNNIRI